MFWAILLLFTTPCGLFAQAPSRVTPANAPADDQILFSAISQDSNGDWRYLKGASKIETSDFTVRADEIDFNSDTNWAYARGHVKFEHFISGDKLNADHAEYNLKTQNGKFYGVAGTSPARIMTSPGLLTTTNPFYFEGRWAERIKDRYVLHDGFVTDCLLPKPWWTFSAPLFDIVPAEHAAAHNTTFRLKRVPLFYLPYFYRPLGKHPRRSGFLTPNLGNSSTRGFMYGGGYYWAINPSYDATYVLQYFTQRGPAHSVDFRGKPNAVTDFNFSLYGVQDKGLKSGNTLIKEGGYQFNITARTVIDGFVGRLDYNYLSSYLFRQSFSQSLNEAVSSEVNAIGFLQRHFKDDQYALAFVVKRNELFEDVNPVNRVIIQKLPSVEFSTRDKEVVSGPLPVWLSIDSSAALMRRQEPSFQTGNGVNRIDIEPRVMTAFQFKGFSLVPSLTFGATEYGNSYTANGNNYSSTTASGVPGIQSPPQYLVAGTRLFRKDVNFAVDLNLPTLERIYTPPKWLHLGNKIKHTIEARATYEYVTGIKDFNRIIHFDETDLLSNTNQLEFSLTNRLYKKDASGNVNEILSWQVLQQRYFDPTFGGAVVAGQRNVVLATQEVSPFAFLDGPRSYSPIVSNLRLTPVYFISVDWRSEYDPVREKFIDNTLTGSVRISKYFLSVGETDVSAYPLEYLVNDRVTGAKVNSNSLLTPPANQIRFGGGLGSPNRKGWNVAFNTDYDFLQRFIIYQQAQVAYNTDCCGFSAQFRRFNFGTRNENQFLMSLSIANIGTFGSLRKQDRNF